MARGCWPTTRIWRPCERCRSSSAWRPRSRHCNPPASDRGAEDLWENPSPRPPPRSGEGEPECLAPPLRFGEGVGGRGSRTGDEEERVMSLQETSPRRGSEAMDLLFAHLHRTATAAP